ncbi:MAG: glycosyltransferase family 2 protein [Ilumatobacteraceae bacterium]
MIIPARNEAESLPNLLHSLAESDLAPQELIVVDDASVDATSEIARTAGATVIAAAALPAGWLGKPWACATGAALASGDVLVFLDADTVLGTGALRSLTLLQRRRGGLCSVQPFHSTRRPYEQLSAMFNASAALGSGAFTFGSRGTRPVAFGPCLVTSRADYQTAGGHASVRDSVIEDISLARAYASNGLPVTCRLGGDSIHFRMYPDGVRSMVQGWTKNIALGAGAAAPLAVAATVVWIAGLAAVAVAAFAATGDWLSGDGVPVIEYVAWIVMAAHLAWILRRLGSFGPLTAILFPVPIAFFIVVFMRSAVLVTLRRPVAWRGRSVPTARRGGS